MQNRRDFLKSTALGATVLGLASSDFAVGFSGDPAGDGAGELTDGLPGGPAGQAGNAPEVSGSSPARGYAAKRQPLVVATWKHGLAANEVAWRDLSRGGSALDAVEAGVRVTEADPASRSVGLGGLPDRDGKVTLDACIMDERSRAGSVGFLQHILHPVSVARLVMEKTPHVMLVGEGALQFALANGFTKQNLLTPEAEAAWREWLKESRYVPQANIENHDTISMLAIDSAGNLAGACTTSGMAFKMHGRVGDSPIIGAALFVDNTVGAACATGHGELVMRTLGSFLVVELMRQGIPPRAACRQAIERIVAGNHDLTDMQVGYLAVSRGGEVGAYCLRPGFNYARHDATGNVLVDAESWL